MDDTKVLEPALLEVAEFMPDKAFEAWLEIGKDGKNLGMSNRDVSLVFSLSD